MPTRLRTARQPEVVHPRLWRVRSQAGISLVETLLAIAILSILLLGIMAGLTTTATVSRSTGQVAAVRNALASVVEKASGAGWPGCASAAVIDARMHDATHVSHIEAPPGYTFAVKAVRSVQPETGSCSTSPATTAVLLTIEVVDDRGEHRLDGDVVIRDRSAKPS